MMTIVPAILATTEEEYQDKLSKIEDSQEFEWVQIDLMDGEFVDNKSVGTEVLGKNKSKLKMEAHLMVDYPEAWIDQLVKVNVERIVFPLEDLAGTKERITHLKNHQIEVGISINPETEVKKLAGFIEGIDVILIMSVHPGFGGQEFIPQAILKIKECARLRQVNNLQFKVGVDGGVNVSNIRSISEAGADYVVMGSHLLIGDIHENLEHLWEAVKSV